MSKQEKLAALIEAVAHYTKTCQFAGHAGQKVQEAFSDYQATPDDPPPRPEMPECVKDLVEFVKRDAEDLVGPVMLAEAVERHYAQPLKLEVGKVYEDDAGEHVKVLWKNYNNHEFTAVNTKTDAIRYYDYRGVCSNVPHNLIREVANG